MKQRSMRFILPEADTIGVKKNYRTEAENLRWICAELAAKISYVLIKLSRFILSNFCEMNLITEDFR